MFASEYGWTVDQIVAIPLDQVAELRHAILYRNGNRTVKGSVNPGEKINIFAKAQSIFDTTQKAWH